MQNIPLPFPAALPASLPELDDEPVYDPAVHLALEPPTHKVGLADLGYGAEEIALCPSAVAISGPFRLLSEEGAAVVLDICRRLAPFARGAVRIERSCARASIARASCATSAAARRYRLHGRHPGVPFVATRCRASGAHQLRAGDAGPADRPLAPRHAADRLRPR
ncbi:MAG: hypothetical protein R3F55_10305 [Alphaproteobacteria bacterium]